MELKSNNDNSNQQYNGGNSYAQGSPYGQPNQYGQPQQNMQYGQQGYPQNNGFGQQSMQSPASSWVCPSCNSTNEGAFCECCGTKRM